jgi:hypothetical protein
MRKTLTYIIIFLIYGFIVQKISTIESYKEHLKIVQEKDNIIDSLNMKIQSINMTLDYQNWIIEQTKDKHPKDLEKIINESE